MARIAVLMGSPRIGGNTNLLVNAMIDGIDTMQNSVDVIYAAKLHINGCIGCNRCYESERNHCVQRDDMQDVYERLNQTDILVIATPVYFYGVSSQLKALIDRLHNPIRNRFHIQKLALLAVCADDRDEVFDSIRTMYRSVLSYFSLEDAGSVTVHGVQSIGDIKNHPALQEARSLGASLCQ